MAEMLIAVCFLIVSGYVAIIIYRACAEHDEASNELERNRQRMVEGRKGIMLDMKRLVQIPEKSFKCLVRLLNRPELASPECPDYSGSGAAGKAKAEYDASLAEYLQVWRASEVRRLNHLRAREIEQSRARRSRLIRMTA